MFGGRVDGSLRDLVLDRRHVFERLEFVLVSVVDSSTEVAAMPWARKWAGSLPGIAFRDPLVLPGELLVEVAGSGEVLFGFDERWVPSRVPVPGPGDLGSSGSLLNLTTGPMP